MQYQVVVENSLTRFENLVNKFINDGWRLQGGVSVMLNQYQGTVFAQALIKEETSK